MFALVRFEVSVLIVWPHSFVELTFFQLVFGW